MINARKKEMCCYPGKTAAGSDRTPPKVCANKWLEKEVDLVASELYIFVGRKAAEYFFPNKDFGELIFNNNIYRNKTAFVLPHPSPLNIKWFKENPKFEEKRIHEIREILHHVIK